MRLLPCGIGLGNARTRLAQPKAQLPEQTLALPHPQLYPIALGDPGRQGLAIALFAGCRASWGWAATCDP